MPPVNEGLITNSSGSVPLGGAYTTGDSASSSGLGFVTTSQSMQEEIYRRAMSTSFFEQTPKKKKTEPNVYKQGQKLLVRGFNYGTGFEVVNEASPAGEDYTFYEVVIERIVIPKGKRQEIKFSNGMAYLDSAEGF